MKREVALEHFQREYFETKNRENLLALNDYYQTRRAALARNFGETWRELCWQLSRAGQAKAAVGYVHFSMLRTTLLERRATLLVEAYDRNWYHDPQPRYFSYDGSWAYDFWFGLAAQLEAGRKHYLGQVTPADVERLLLRESGSYLQFIVALIRYAMRDESNVRAFKELALEEQAEIRVGEYKDLSEVVYKEDQRIKDAGAVKRWLEAKREPEYAYEVFRELKLAGGDYQGINLSYADLRGSRFDGSQLQGSILVGARLAGGCLEQADLRGSILYAADFQGCNLKNARFNQVQGAWRSRERTGPGVPFFEPVNLRETDLTGADFTSADLRGADFRGANLTGTLFDGARLEQAVFDPEVAGGAVLSLRQSRQVVWG